MSKYEEILNKQIKYAEFTENPVVCLDIEVAKGLLTYPKSPTLEEVKKEWEAKGWRWEEDEIYITLRKQKYGRSIKIDKKLKEYKCYDLFKTPTLLHTNNIALWISIQEHQLLIKTFIMLGWL